MVNGGAAMSFLTDEDCKQLLENWGAWARAGNTRIGYKSKSNFYSVGASDFVDEESAQLVERAMVEMHKHNKRNLRHVMLLKYKYYHQKTDRDIARQLGVTRPTLAIHKSCAHELIYDYVRRVSTLM